MRSIPLWQSCCSASAFIVGVLSFGLILLLVDDDTARIRLTEVWQGVRSPRAEEWQALLLITVAGVQGILALIYAVVWVRKSRARLLFLTFAELVTVALFLAGFAITLLPNYHASEFLTALGEVSFFVSVYTGLWLVQPGLTWLYLRQSGAESWRREAGSLGAAAVSVLLWLGSLAWLWARCDEFLEPFEHLASDHTLPAQVKAFITSNGFAAFTMIWLPVAAVIVGALFFRKIFWLPAIAVGLLVLQPIILAEYIASLDGERAAENSMLARAELSEWIDNDSLPGVIDRIADKSAPSSDRYQLAWQLRSSLGAADRGWTDIDSRAVIDLCLPIVRDAKQPLELATELFSLAFHRRRQLPKAEIAAQTEEWEETARVLFTRIFDEPLLLRDASESRRMIAFYYLQDISPQLREEFADDIILGIGITPNGYSGPISEYDRSLRRNAGKSLDDLIRDRRFDQAALERIVDDLVEQQRATPEQAAYIREELDYAFELYRTGKNRWNSPRRRGP